MALLVGAVVPMDLRLIGVWRGDVRLETVLRLLRPMAAAGAALAVPTGMLLFTVQATDYVALRLFFVKLALVALGLAHALAWGSALARAPAAASVSPARSRSRSGAARSSAAGCSAISDLSLGHEPPRSGRNNSHKIPCLCFAWIIVLT